MNSVWDGTATLRFMSEKRRGRRWVANPSLKEIVEFCWASALINLKAVRIGHGFQVLPPNPWPIIYPLVINRWLVRPAIVATVATVIPIPSVSGESLPTLAVSLLKRTAKDLLVLSLVSEGRVESFGRV